MLENADDLLLTMEQQTHGLVESDEKIQQLLTWVETKSSSADGLYKPAAVRAFFLDLSLALTRDIELSLN